MKIENITGIILAGGKSLRAGVNKANLKLNDKTILEIIASKLGEKLSNILLVTNEQKEYEYLTLETVPDIFPGLGPLSGIHAGLSYSPTDLNFVVSVDIPFINADFIEFLVSQNFSADIIIPTSNGKYHTLCAIYHKNCVSVAEKLLKKAAEERKKDDVKSPVRLFDLVNKMHVDYLDISNEEFFNDLLMYNMNTYEDYEFVKKIFNEQIL